MDIELRSVNGRDMQITRHEGKVMVSFKPGRSGAGRAQNKHDVLSRMREVFGDETAINFPLHRDASGNLVAEEDDIIQAINKRTAKKLGRDDGPTG